MGTSIETGLRIPGSEHHLASYLNVARSYNTNHLQIHASGLTDIVKISEQIRTQLGSRIELSYSIDDPGSSVNIFVDQFDDLLQAAEKFNAKFLIAPLQLLPRLEAKGLPSYSVIERIISRAENNKKLFCLEAVLGNREEINSSPASLNNLKEAHPSRFLLFAINIPSLVLEPALEEYTKRLRTVIGTVHVNVSRNGLSDSQYELHFGNLLGRLFGLPFQQQPLIFTNPLEELPDVYERFSDLISKLDYWYP